MARFRRLARDDERLAATVAALHFVAFACLMLQKLFHPSTQQALGAPKVVLDRSGLGTHDGHQVRVGVEGERDGGTTEHFDHDFRVHSLGQEQRGRRVPQIMKADRR
jgi:hypothetical protein